MVSKTSYRYLTWLEGTLRSEWKRVRANNLRLGTASGLSGTAPAPLSRRAAWDKEEGRIPFQRRQVTLLFRSSTFKSCEFVSTTGIQFPPLDPCRWFIAERGGLRSSFFFFFEKLGKSVGGLSWCCKKNFWLPTTYWFSVRQHWAQITSCHGISWVFFLYLQLPRPIYGLSARCLRATICQVNASKRRGCSPAHTNMRLPNTAFAFALTCMSHVDVIFLIRCKCKFSYNCIILSVDRITRTHN